MRIDKQRSLIEHLKARQAVDYDPFVPSFRSILKYKLQTLAMGLCKAPSFAGNPYLNLGFGDVPFSGWINADFVRLRRWMQRDIDGCPVWWLDAGRNWNCPDNVWGGIFTEHMLEHLTYSAAENCLREAWRTLIPGGWLRAIVPDVSSYVEAYAGRRNNGDFATLPKGSHLFWKLCQCYGHVSAWDADAVREFMEELGYIKIAKRSYMEGSDPQLLKDSGERAWCSVYVEGQKPL